MWLGLAAIATTTILIAGRNYDRLPQFSWLAFGFAVASMLLIGACFRTQLAAFLRLSAAVLMVLAAFTIVGWHMARSPGWVIYGGLGTLAALSIVYLPIVQRLGWLYVFAIQIGAVLIAVAWSSFESKAVMESNWPIQSGLVCFIIGLSITSVKSGLYQRCCSRWPRRRRRYRPGF